MASNKARTFGTPECPIGLHTGDARIATVAAQPAGFGEFGGGTFGFAFEGIGGGEPGVNERSAGLALRAFSSQTIASSVRDCSRCTFPIRKYQ